MVLSIRWFRRLSVEDNIRAVLEMTKMTKEEQKDRLEEMLDEFGLQHIRKSLGIQLSGGERRRTEIARALSIRPKFILLDEPFAGVDPIAVEDIQNIVQKLKDKNIGILITDHNVQETLSITDRAYLLYDGRILQAGTAEHVSAAVKCHARQLSFRVFHFFHCEKSEQQFLHNESGMSFFTLEQDTQR